MIWAIGDIHGMYDPLQRLLLEIRYFDQTGDPLQKIIFLGDYIDHGPSSKAVIDLVSRLDVETVLLMGDHEDMALRFLKGGASGLRFESSDWLGNGTADTYLSLCYDPANAHKAKRVRRLSSGEATDEERLVGDWARLPRRYERFLASLRYSHREVLSLGDGREIAFTFCHGLPSKDISLADQRAANWKEFSRGIMETAARLVPGWGEMAP
jgi:hypothetical protein